MQSERKFIPDLKDIGQFAQTPEKKIQTPEKKFRLSGNILKTIALALGILANDQVGEKPEQKIDQMTRAATHVEKEREEFEPIVVERKPVIEKKKEKTELEKNRERKFNSNPMATSLLDEYLESSDPNVPEEERIEKFKKKYWEVTDRFYHEHFFGFKKGNAIRESKLIRNLRIYYVPFIQNKNGYKRKVELGIKKAKPYAGKVIIEGIIGVENGVFDSSQGAAGVMQLMPQTAKDMGVKDIRNPTQNVIGGAKYFYKLRKKFGSIAAAAPSYNGGDGNFADILKECGYITAAKPREFKGPFPTTNAIDLLENHEKNHKAKKSSKYRAHSAMLTYSLRMAAAYPVTDLMIRGKIEDTVDYLGSLDVKVIPDKKGKKIKPKLKSISKR